MKLDLYSGREPHIVIADVNGEQKEFKISSDLTVEEYERLYEIEAQLKDEKDFERRMSMIYNQVLLAFKRYNPEMTVEDIKSIFSLKEILKIVSFIALNSFGGVSEKDEKGNIVGEPSKKKDQVNSSSHSGTA